MNIIELAEVVGETPRQIRYLIAEGFIPNPDGSRARPEYRESHVEAIAATSGCGRTTSRRRSGSCSRPRPRRGMPSGSRWRPASRW
ncbi:MerR family transcriptional regulator [Paeniroseomonas aquatica]|uniref:MerR family transcriptional regulator n=1 Tax=Paeniroseomonas aquatica TaxID=373043 RepID=UPI003608B176